MKYFSVYTLFTTSVLLIACGQQPGKTTIPLQDTIAKQPATGDSLKDQPAPNEADYSGFISDTTLKVPAEISAEIPPNYSVLDLKGGDLNLDEYPDLLVVLKRTDEAAASDTSLDDLKRPLLIFIGQADKKFKYITKNESAIYCLKCGGVMGDPYQGLVIKKGYFSLEHYGGSSDRWSSTITFKYNPADSIWYLHKDGSSTFNTFKPEKVKTTIKTIKDFGKVRFEAFDIYNN